MTIDIKKKQTLLMWGLIGVLALSLSIIVGLLVNTNKVINTSKKLDKKNLITGTSRVNPQEVWVHDFNAKAELTQKRLEALEKTLEKVIQLNTSSGHKEESLVNETPVASLRKDLLNSENSHALTELPNQAAILPKPPGVLLNPSLKNKQSSSQFRSKTLKKVSLNLQGKKKHSALNTSDTRIPAGSFAQAILLGGVDASTSIQASSDPRPILLRLTNPGTLPRRFSSDLEGCHVLAASFGDISSERVFMRLEKLSCVERRTGEVMEMDIHGYVAGEDGRAGIRGAVVDRAGVSMRNAMVGGFFSSIGNFLGQSKNPILFSPTAGLAQTNPLSGADLFKQSAGKGMGGALEKYADFYIKRAEQMQPVIEVASGRSVDIVFTQGIEFADSAERKTLSKMNDLKRYQQIQNLEETKAVQNWLPTSEGGQK